MDLKITDEQQHMVDLAHDFAENVIRPAELELDKISDPETAFASDTYKNVMKKAYEIGFHKMIIAETYGGLGLDMFTMELVVEQLAWGGAGLASAILVAPVAQEFAALFTMGDKKIINKFVRPFCEDTTGEISSAWAITEPDIGSDSCIFDDPEIRFRTTAVLKGDEYIINGTKAAWVSNGGLATLYMAMVNIEPENGMMGTGIFLIPGDLPGVSTGKALDKLGLRALNQAEVYFDEVHVPKEYLIVQPSPVYQNMLETIVTMGNTGVGLLAVGVMQAAYDQALAYSKERVQGKVPIFEHQIIQMKLMEAFYTIDAARSYLHNVGWWNANSFPGDIRRAAGARTFACNSAPKVTSEMIQILGGYGISKEYEIEKYYRDAKLLQIMDGTVEMLCMLAAARL